MDVLLLTFKSDRGHNLANALRGYGHTVTVAGVTLGKDPSILRMYRVFTLVVKHYGKHDIIIVENPFWDAVTALILARIGIHKTPLVFYSKGFTVPIWRETLPKIIRGIGFIILKQTILKADYIVYITQWLRDKFIEESGIRGITDKPYSIIHHAPNPFFLEQLTSDSDKSTDSGSSNKIKICYAGRFDLRDKTRGILLLLDALLLETQKCPDISLHLYVAGDGKYLPYLKETTTKLNLDDKVTFTGKLSQSSLRNLYQSSDIFVYPSFQDGCPTVVMEAQACGIPAIVTNTCGAVELVENGTTGIICGPAAEELASALAELILDPTKRKTMGLQAREHIKHNLSWEVSAQKFNEVLNLIARQYKQMNKTQRKNS